MPFTKLWSNLYNSKSGKLYTEKQVNMYYATGGFKRGIKKKYGKSRPKSKN